MKSYNTAYYLLTVLLITGAFASMAQNDYGMTILSGVSFVFAMVFLVQFIRLRRVANKNNRTDQIEFFVLFLLAFVFMLRTFQLYVPFLEGIFGAAGIFLAIIYLIRLYQHSKSLRSKNQKLSTLVMVSYGSVVLFCIAMVLQTPMPQVARLIGIPAILMAIVFLVSAVLMESFSTGAEKYTLVATISSYKDRFFLLLSLFLLFSLYIGLTGRGTLPHVYSDNYPQAYYHLIHEAESGQEKKVDGKYRYEDFRENYDQFVEDHLSSEKHESN